MPPKPFDLTLTVNKITGNRVKIGILGAGGMITKPKACPPITFRRPCASYVVITGDNSAELVLDVEKGPFEDSPAPYVLKKKKQSRKKR